MSVKVMLFGDEAHKDVVRPVELPHMPAVGSLLGERQQKVGKVDPIHPPIEGVSARVYLWPKYLYPGVEG